MMGRSLLILGALATAGMAVAAVLGYGLDGPTDPAVSGHLLASLASTLMLVFSHSWILLYLLGTGRAVRDAVKEFQLEPEVIAASRALRRRSIPWLLLAALLAMATFLLGIAGVPGLVPLWVHHALFFATLAVQVLALWIEGRALSANEKLLTDIDHRIPSAPVPNAV
jgi:hypothetical protein